MYLKTTVLTIILSIPNSRTSMEHPQMHQRIGRSIFHTENEIRGKRSFFFFFKGKKTVSFCPLSADARCCSLLPFCAPFFFILLMVDPTGTVRGAIKPGAFWRFKVTCSGKWKVVFHPVSCVQLTGVGYADATKVTLQFMSALGLLYRSEARARRAHWFTIFIEQQSLNGTTDDTSAVSFRFVLSKPCCESRNRGQK